MEICFKGLGIGLQILLAHRLTLEIDGLYRGGSSIISDAVPIGVMRLNQGVVLLCVLLTP